MDKVLEVAQYIGERWFPRTILAGLVACHCRLFPVNYRDKQKMATALNINYKRILTMNPSKRLTS